LAHYALLDGNNIVTQVIVGENENTNNKNWELEYSQMFGVKCKRTSYNTYGNQHELGKAPFRKNYAEIGGTYDPKLNAFYAQKPFSSWALNTETLLWEAPTPQPVDNKFVYQWSELNQEWFASREIPGDV
jgi:hypothetical protein